MIRRQLLHDFLKAIAAWFGFAVVQGLPPVIRINAVRLGNEAWGQDCLEELCAVDDPSFCPTDELCAIDDPSFCPVDGEHPTEGICAVDTPEACTEDVCTTQDACTDDSVGHVCSQRDVCDIDTSSDCHNDECSNDRSFECIGDNCSTDSSGECIGDECTDDSSGECFSDTCGSDSSYLCQGDSCTDDSSGGCRTDTCENDSSGDCRNDVCESDSSRACVVDSCAADSSGVCTSDECIGDSAGECISDECASDKSGLCVGDSCTADSSGPCRTDACSSDSSGACRNDGCQGDSSGSCTSDFCEVDSSRACISDDCAADSSGSCVNETCIADSSGSCISDECVADKSDSCKADKCEADNSAGCAAGDRCNTDTSGACLARDVCVLDASTSCDSDLCREDRTPEGSECASADTCALDLALNEPLDRRHLARAGLNKAVKWLYRISTVIVLLNLPLDPVDADTVIDASNAVIFPEASFTTASNVTVLSPVGPFIRDCDEDDIDEADTNGDGLCANDPELLDYNGDGSRELPAGTPFTGDFKFECFHIPDDVAIIATGPLTIGASREVAVFGAVRLPASAIISSPMSIDLRSSAWLSEDVSASFITGQSGEVDQTQTVLTDDTVPSIAFTSVCTGATGPTDPPARPTGIMATDGVFPDKVRVTFNTVAGATVYRVFRCLTTGQTCGTPIGFPKTGSFDDRKGVPGIVYYYRVRACSPTKCGKFSVANSGYSSPRPDRPTGINATDGVFISMVRVTFNTVAGATVYRVFRCLTTGQTCGTPIGFPKTGIFDDKKGDPGTVYYYRVKACNTIACGKFSVANTGYRKKIPDRPTGIRASDGTYTQRVRVTWDGVADATVYRVFRCPTTGPDCGTPVGYPKYPVFDDFKGEIGIVYYYRIKACTATACSLFSVANPGHRGSVPATQSDVIVPAVPIPVLTGRFVHCFLILMILGLGLVFRRKYG